MYISRTALSAAVTATLILTHLASFKMVGRVEVPQEAFVAALATDADIEKVKAARKAGQ